MITCFGARLDCRVKSDAWLVPRRPSLPIPFAIGPFGKVSKTWSLFGVHCHFRLASVHTIISQSWHGLHKQDIPKKKLRKFPNGRGGYDDDDAQTWTLVSSRQPWRRSSTFRASRAEAWNVVCESESEKWKWKRKVKYGSEIWKWNMKVKRKRSRTE